MTPEVGRQKSHKVRETRLEIWSRSGDGSAVKGLRCSPREQLSSQHPCWLLTTACKSSSSDLLRAPTYSVHTHTDGKSYTNKINLKKTGQELAVVVRE